MKNSLISVVMPVKNTAQYIEDCLNSILNQTHTKWELLAVDDHSTDNSLEILASYADKDRRIKVFKNKGKGIIDALRLSYSKSSGDLITRMDSDDLMAEDKLTILSSNLINRGRGHLAVGLVKYFSDNELGEGFKNYELWLNGLTAFGSNFKEIYKECVIPSPCWMVHREDLETSGSFRPNRYPEDYDLTFRFYLNGLKVIACDEVLHHWRDYPSRTSRTHAHYADNSFMEIKVHYFLKKEYDTNKNLVVWGAGGKGKALAQLLIDKNIDFYWICDNPKKIGNEIYGKVILAFKELDRIEHTQSIITVANPLSKIEIKHYFEQRSDEQGVDYFFFC